MLHYPNIDPIAFHIWKFPVHWYGLMYLFGFICGWTLLQYRARKTGLWTSEQITDLLFYVVLGVVLGARIGYVIFYNLSYYFHHPSQIIAVWDGGMSFHGGLIGVILMALWWSFKQKRAFFDVSDFIAPVIPIGLGFGRIGNFINGELWGRVTTMPWGMVYPKAGPLPRHPSELYEFFLEGVVLFIVLWLFSRKPRPRMAVSGLFLLLYACFRIFCEFFRQPDPQLGFVAFGWITRGQELCVPMFIFGIIFLYLAYRNKKYARAMPNSEKKSSS
ncbi:MAG: prolipoprotein diacylglyceryl transferase [Pseudomonadota bacterium]